MDDGVAAAIEKETVRRLAIATRPTDFLVVTLDIFWQMRVDDKPHVRFVDSHAESNSSNHEWRFVIDKVSLVGAASHWRQSRVIGQGGPSVLRKRRREFIGVVSSAA